MVGGVERIGSMEPPGLAGRLPLPPEVGDEIADQMFAGFVGRIMGYPAGPCRFLDKTEFDTGLRVVSLPLSDGCYVLWANQYGRPGESSQRLNQAPANAGLRPSSWFAGVGKDQDAWTGGLGFGGFVHTACRFHVGTLRRHNVAVPSIATYDPRP